MRALARVAVGVAASAFGACTVLIPFDEPAGREPSGARDAGEAGDDDGAEASIAVCASREGRFCGGRLEGWTGGGDDLVECADGGVRSVTTCQQGAGCLRLPSPHTDECDRCAEVGDGARCGSEMSDWSPGNAEMSVSCERGRATSTTVCQRCIPQAAGAVCN